MTDRPAVATIAPFFIVGELARAVAFYEQKLGFTTLFSTPADAPFFAIVGRDAVQLYLKEVDPQVTAQPNHTRHPWAPWDAFVLVPDPDALATELAGRGVAFHAAPGDRDDGLRGFAVADADGYVLFFGRPQQ